MAVWDDVLSERDRQDICGGGLGTARRVMASVPR